MSLLDLLGQSIDIDHQILYIVLKLDSQLSIINVKTVAGKLGWIWWVFEPGLRKEKVEVSGQK